MTLKELRIKMGLTQDEAAQILGLSRRSYQNYETDLEKANTFKYQIYLERLKQYHDENMFFKERVNLSFYTNVFLGNDLKLLIKSVAKFKKRDCFKALKKYIEDEYFGKVCILYGLRRTGKTTLIFQMLSEINSDEAAYIKIQKSDSMANLTKDLNMLNHRGIKYVFIDEITLLSDFIDTSSILSDTFAMMGMKIVLSGTDSLGFIMADRNELYDRNVMIHTSFIPFSEYARLLDIYSIDSYIEYGGTLKCENMSFDDEDYLNEEVSFKDLESTRKYIDTSISKNIQHTLKNDNFGSYFNELKELYDRNELTNVINRVVENINHDFLESVIKDRFISHDLGSTKNLMLHNAPDDIAYELDNINYDEVIKILKRITDIKEESELETRITKEHIEKLKKILIVLDLIVNIPNYLESGKACDHFVFTQPGMRYAITKALIYALMQDEYFKNLSEKKRNTIIDKMISDVKGRMLEDIVLLETHKYLTKDVFRFKFDLGGEFDMVIYDKDTNTCSIFEIKHSTKKAKAQIRHLSDEEKIKKIEERFGKVENKYVLYRGEDDLENDIKYLNVEKYLIALNNKSIY